MISTAFRPGRRWAAGIVFVCASFFAGCNESESGSSLTPRDQPSLENRMLGNIVTAQDLQQAPAGSPQRGMLEWFQAVQFQDIEGARQFTAPGVLRHTDRRRFEWAVGTVGSGLGRPVIVNVRRSRKGSTVRVLIQAFQPGRAKPIASDPESFSW